MVAEWDTVLLGDVVTLQRGFDLPTQDRLPGTVPIVSSSGVTGTHAEGRVKGPGVVTGRYGTIGEVFYVDEDFWPLNTTLYVKDFKGNDPLFVSYLLRTIDYGAHNDKSSVPGVNRNHLHTVPVLRPPLPEQRAIAHILGTLDDKIALNRRMNATLEELARALFRSWFVAFDPMRARAEGRQPAGMDAATAALFPDSFEETELGEVPAGWRVLRLGDLTSYLSRGIGPSYIDAGGVLVLNQKCIRDGHLDSSKGRRHDPAKRSVDGRTVQIGDILVNSTGVGTLGRVAQVLYLEEDAIVDSHVTIVRNNPLLVTWNYLGMAIADRQADIEALGEGSTGQTELSRDRLRSLFILVPPQACQQAFDDLTLPIRRQLAALQRQSKVLEQVRDALLAKLLSGEIRVREAERELEAAR